MFLYIDPATGGMLFTILFGLMSAVLYFFRSLMIKVKYSIRKKDIDEKMTTKLPIVIFSDHKRYWNVFEPICDELEKRDQKTYYYTMSEDDPALVKEYSNIICEYIGSGNKAFSRMNLLNATIVVSTTPSLDVFQWKRSKNVDYYIHIPHAASDITMYHMFGIDYYDAVLLSGQYQVRQIRELERLRNLDAKDLKLAGIPYMDELRRRVSMEGSNRRDDNPQRTVLLAPSWGESGILKKYGTVLIDALVDTGYRIVIRPHPQSYMVEKDVITTLMEKYSRCDNVEWNNDNDNFDILSQTDILISDFSGIIFDFALIFDKSVIYTEPDYDKSPYDCAWLEEELWTFEILPQIGKQLELHEINDIKRIIDECIKSTEYRQGRERARKETWANIGNGAEIMTDYIIEKLSEINQYLLQNQ